MASTFLKNKAAEREKVVSGEKTSRASSFLRNKASERDAAVSSGSAKRTSTQNSKAPSTAPQVLPEQRTPSIDVGTWNAQRRAILNNPVLQRDEKLESIARDRVNRLMDSYDTDNAIADRIRGLEEQKRSLDGLAVPSLESAEESKRLDEQIARARAAQEARTYVPDQQLPTESAMTDKALTDRLFALELEKKNIDESPIPSLEGSARSAELSGQIDNVQDAMRARGLYAEDFDESEYYKGILETGATSTAHNVWSSIDFLANIPRRISAKISGVEYAPDEEGFFHKRSANTKKEYEAAVEKYKNNLERGGKMAEVISDLGVETINAIPMALMAFSTGGGSAALNGADVIFKSAEIPSLARTTASVISSMAKDPNFYVAFMSTVGNSYEEAIEKGASEDQAVLYALFNGVLNASLEGEYGFQAMARNPEAWTWETFVKEGMLGEAKEEITQGIVERGLENLVFNAGNKFFSTDMNDTSAVINPFTALREGASGAVIGGILSGAGMANATLRGSIQENIASNRADNVLQAVREALVSSGMNEQDARRSAPIVASLMQAGAEEQEAVSLAPAVEKALQGEAISGNDAAKIAQSDAAVSLIESVTGTEIDTDAPISEVKTAIKAFANRFEAGNETRSINPSTEESVAETGDFSAREALAPIAETLGEAGGRFLLTNAEGVADAESYAKDFVRVYNAARNNEAIPQTDLTLSQQYSAERSGKIDRAADIARGVTEENVNGGEDIRLREGSERTYGENPERQAGVLAEGAGRDQAADEGRDVSAVLGRAKDVGASQSTLSEIKNTASFGIGGGKANDVLYEVTGGFSPAMQEARNIAKKAGLRLTLYAGDYMTVRGEQIRGYVSGDRVFVRADDPEFTAAQIMKHEAGHDAIAKGEIDIKSIKESVKANLEKIGMSLDEMTALYDMAYKGSGMNADEIFEEIICDSLGNMNIFAASFSERLTAPVDQFLSIVRETVDENRQARAPTEAEARSGEPKYSAMYRNRAESFDDFYDFVLANQDDPNEINKSYYRMELKDGGAVDVPFDAIIHVENGHRISKSQYHELFDALSGQIEAAVVSNGLNRKNIVPMLLKVNTPNGKAVVVIDFNEKGRNIFKTAFFDNEVKIDNWLNEKGSRRLASKGRSSLPGNLYSVSTIQDELFGVKPDDQESKGKYSRSVSFQEEEQEIKDLESRVNELKAQQREADSARKKLEASQEYKDFLASLDNKDEAQLKKSLAEYSKWEKESGLSDAVKKREKILNELRPLESQLRDLQKDLYNKHKQEYRAKYNDEFAKKYASKAARRFGMTGRYDLAGYLTTNGSLLDFSEGQRQRTRDHREISEVLDFLPDDAAYSDGMIEFMNLGNIRLQTYGFDIAKKPNAKQVKLLRDFIRRLDGEVTVDISGENGDSLYSLEYPEGTRADRIINDLNSYFDKGIEPQISDTQRFHAEDDFYDNNTRYSRRVDDKKILDFLNNQETVKTYKTMQLVDGKLYPPMAARVKGKYEDASELGKWEEAVEHPELVKKGQFKLDKGKGQGSMEVAYNPYMHSSNLVLNDQFTGAHARNNLVTVECEVPVSETESGYKAEGAKDSVGWLPWHSGTVAGQLRAAKGIERQVLLSRWIKPVRIVPDAEVASMYKDLLDGTDIQVPDNVVTPALLAELKKAGVKIKESGRVKNISENLNRKTELKDSAGENAVLVDEGTAMKFSRKTWSETDQKKLASDLEGMGFEKKEVNKWIGDVNSVAAFIASNSDKLDYVAAENQTAMKTDEEYIYSMDFSTLCAKRLLYQGTYNAIQHALPNYAIMPGDTLLIRHIMDEKGYEVPCGFCYVESRRKHLGKFAEKWLSEVGRKKYGIKNADVATTDGLENLRTSNPDAYEDFTAWMRQRGSANPKVVELRTAYGENTGILDLSPGTIDTLKRIGGLRIQSFSDFEIPHVIDVMQIAFDMARMGLTSQAYTKVPAFAYIFGPTGIKINLSVVADVDENGNLVFNDKEGIDHNEAFKIRDMYSDTCGTILVGKNEQQIISAMEDPRIDFIIPFHRSGWGNAEFRVLGLRGYKDFQSLQGEYNVDYSPLSPQRKKASGFLFPEDYWDYSVSGNENTVNYLNKCRELNRVPRFLCFAFDPSVARDFVAEYNGTHSSKISVDDILTAEGMSRLCRKNKSAQAKGLRQVAFDYLEYGLDHGAKVQDGYWKTLIDFKMYDNEGNPAPQGTVRPEFNMEYARKFMSEYDKDPNNLPVAQDVVDEFVELVKTKQTDKYLRRIKDAERRADTTRFSRKADADYMKAVEAGDMAAARKMVDEAANRIMSDSVVRGADGKLAVMYHGSLQDFNAFDKGKIRAVDYDAPFNGFWFSSSEDTSPAMQAPKYVRSFYLDIKNPAPYEVWRKMDKQIMSEWREDDNAVREGARSVNDELRFRLIDEGYDGIHYDGPYVFTEENVEEYNKTGETTFRNAGGRMYDLRKSEYGDARLYPHNSGAEIMPYESAENFLEDNSVYRTDDVWVAFDPEQIKSADAVTYDDNGNVIPLSERFNEDEQDIRYSRALDIDGGKVYQGRVVLNESTVDKYLRDYAAPSTPNYAQAYITYIAPARFLDLTTTKQGRDVIAAQTGPLDVDELKDATVYQPIQMRIETETGQVVGHEGRHRALALERSGVSRIPVLLFDSSNKYDKQEMDSLTLKGQEFQNGRSNAIATVHDVIPMSYANRDKIVETFATPTGTERVFERYGHDLVRYSRRVATFDDLKKENDSLREKLADYEKIRKDLAAAQQRAEAAEAQLRPTTVRTVRAEDVDKLARDEIKSFSSSANKKDVARRMLELGNKIVQGEELDYNDLKSDAVSIAADIVAGAQELTNSEQYEELSQVAATLKGQRIYFDNYRGVDRNAQGYEKTDANYRSGKGEIQDYSDFRKHNFGRFTLTSDPTNARMVDDVYQELQAQFGEGLFPADITNDVDQLQYISDLLDGREKVYQNPYEYDMAEAIEFEANRILDGLIADSVRQTAPTQADKWAHKYEKLKYEDAVSKAEAVARIRQNRDEQIRRLKQAYADAAERRRERKIESSQRTRLLKIARRLANMKLPKVSRDLIQQYIGDLDLVAKSITGQKVEKLQALRDWYEDQRENNPDFIPDSNIEKALQRLSKIQISSMTQEDVLDLTNVLLNIEHEIRTQKQLIGKEERRTVAQLGADTINDIENTKGVREGTARYALDSFFVNNTLSPLREIRRITGYKEDSPLNVAANDLADGQRKMFDFQRRAGKLFQKWTEDKAFVKMISGKDAKEITVKGKDAKGDVTVKITPAMRMSLYLHSKNEQNLRSIVDGGVTIPDIKLYKDGKYDAAYNQGRLVRFTPSQLHEIAAGMSAKEKAFADAASEYWNGLSQEEINQTSEQLKGYSLANVENYFPINRDKNFLKADFDSIKFDGTIEGMGFLKERVKAANPMLLRDMNLVLKQSIDQTAKYVGMAIPVRNWSKIWGVTKASYDTDESGKQVRTGYEGSVQQAVKRKWGQSAYDYIERMMKNVNASNVNTDDFGKMLSRVRSNYAKAVLTLNLSVAMKQAASYPTAGAVLGFRPLARAMANFGKVNLDLIEKYTPLQWYRTQGFSTQELGDMAKRDKSLPKLLNWVQGMDLITTRKLWKASEYYVRQNNKALRVGSDAYYRAVADVYNRVIEETQPNYTTMQRPHLLRSDNELVQTTMMFKTQPFQNFNVLYDAYGNLSAKRAAYVNLRKGMNKENAEAVKAAYKEAQKNAFNATWSQLMQLAVFSGMSFAWALLRGKLKDYKDDDKEEMTLRSALSRIGRNMIGSAASGIPFGSEAWELASSAVFGDKYYGFDNVTASSIDDLANAFLKASGALQDIVSGIQSGDGVDINKQRLAFDSVLKAVSKTVGVPYENVENLFNAVFLQSAKAAAGPYVGGYAYLRLTTDPTKYPGDFYDILYKAYKNDQESYQLIYDDMIGSGDFAEDKIKSNMEKRMKEDQGVSTVDELDSRYMSPDQQAKYDQYIAGVEGSKIWNKATEEQRDKLEENAYNLAIGSKTGSKIQEKIDKAGVSDTEYLLYTLALSITDKPTESGKYGSYTNPEVEEAINMVKGLSDDEKTALWIAQGKSEKSSPW